MNEARNPYSNSTMKKMGVRPFQVRPGWSGEDEIDFTAEGETCPNCGKKIREISKGTFNPSEKSCGCPPWKRLAAIGWGM